MTLTDLFYDHARRIAAITHWHAMGWISDKERIRYEVYETETTEALYNQVVKEACPVHY